MSYISVQGNFTTLPNDIIRDRGLSPSAYGITKERIYEDHPKDSKYSLNKAFSELLDADYIQVVNGDE